MSSIALSNSCFVEVFNLPQELYIKSKTDFAEMFSLCPENKHRVVVKDFELEVKRYSKSYGQTPGITKLINTGQVNNRKYVNSYMFSGIDDSDNNNDLPQIFQPYFRLVNETFKDCDFNQVTVNWYRDGQDYIAFHKDCEIGMRGDKKICILTFNESDEQNEIRYLSFRPMQVGNSSDPETTIPLPNGSIVMFNTEVQKYYKHGIRKSDATTKRISLSFRQFEKDM